jgi:hypothetical protein
MRTEVDCIDNCPCHTNCIDGCNDCQNAICLCDDIESDLDYIECTSKVAVDFSNCVGSCDSLYDYNSTLDDCIVQCVNSREESLKMCPCQEYCPLGCPCPNNAYSCNHMPIDLDEYAVLAMNTYTPNEKAVLIDFHGYSQSFYFSMGNQSENEVEVHRSCSVLYKNDMIVFGGYDIPTQISKVDNCQLNRWGDLPFRFQYGTCDVFKLEIEGLVYEDDIVLLCFAFEFQHSCIGWDGSNYKMLPSNTSVSHYYSRLSNYRGLPFITGGFKTKMVEELKYGKWTDLAQYPYAQSYIRYYATVSTPTSVLIFGGDADGYPGFQSDMVAQFSEGYWSQLGRLVQQRGYHGAVQYGSKTMIFGGGDLRFTEIWDQFHSSSGDYVATLGDQHYNYYLYPELFVVPRDFCSYGVNL